MKLFGRRKKESPSEPTEMPRESKGDYDDWVREVIQHSVHYIQSKNPFFTFVDAFKGVENYIQRDTDSGQQVLQQQRKLNIELMDNAVLLYVPDADVRRVTMSAVGALSDFLGVELQIEDLSDHPNMTNLHQTEGRAPNSIYMYRLNTYNYSVPDPNDGNLQIPGTHVALSFQAGLPF